jgi:membrane protein
MQPTAGPWAIPLAGWKDAVMRAFDESAHDNIALIAAGVSFYGFLALVPFIGATVLVYGLLSDPHDVIHHVASLTAMMPREVAGLIGEQLMAAVKASDVAKGSGVAVSLALALFGARNGAVGIIDALDIAFEVGHRRGFLRETVLGLAITAGAVLFAVIAVAFLAVLALVREALPDREALAVLFHTGDFIGLVALAAAAAATLYRFGPARKNTRWVWLTPGSVLFALGWAGLTIGFGFYVRTFGHYDRTYGSLAAVIMLLTWFYLASWILLFGAELNAEFEKSAAGSRG